jgi:hypothetical protein
MIEVDSFGAHILFYVVVSGFQITATTNWNDTSVTSEPIEDKK